LPNQEIKENINTLWIQDI